jgi:hypothetical protein
MLEGALKIREETGLVQELGDLKAADGGMQICLGLLGDGLENGQRHVLPHHRPSLEEYLVLGSQPVDAGGQYGLHRGRDLDGRHRSRQPVGAALAGQGSGLGQRPHALLGRTGRPPSARSAGA